MTANFQIRVFGHGTENFKKCSDPYRMQTPESIAKKLAKLIRSAG